MVDCPDHSHKIKVNAMTNEPTQVRVLQSFGAVGRNMKNDYNHNFMTEGTEKMQYINEIEISDFCRFDLLSNEVLSIFILRIVE